jgi:hypothetical protein
MFRPWTFGTFASEMFTLGHMRGAHAPLSTARYLLLKNETTGRMPIGNVFEEVNDLGPSLVK